MASAAAATASTTAAIRRDFTGLRPSPIETHQQNSATPLPLRRLQIRAAKSSPRLPNGPLRVAVIGGGPAGGAAAETLARGGIDTILIERKLDNCKPCGGAIPLCMVSEFDIPLDIIDRRVTKMKMISPSNVAVDIGRTLKPHEYIGMVRREVLDAHLRDRAAAAGATVVNGLFLRMDTPTTPMAPYTIHYNLNGGPAGEKCSVEVDAVIGADGANSRVAKSIDAGSYDYAIAFQERVKISESKMEYYKDLAEMYVGDDVSPDFYGWVFPKCDHVAVGTGTVTHKSEIKRFQAATRLRAKDKIEGGKIIRVEAHPIPEHPRPRRNNSEIEKLKLQLSSEFEMKDLGKAKKILGMEISRDRKNGRVKLSQTAYIKKILQKFGISEATKSVSTPLAHHFKLSTQCCPKSQEERLYMKSIPYASAVGSLMYAMVCTRPDISQAVSVVSRFMHDPGKEHWQAVKWILRYLHGTTSVGLIFEKQVSMEDFCSGYVDSDYAGDLDKRKSMTGYVFTMAGGAICWRSILQSTVALSTTEAEYMAATEAVKEAIWLQGMLDDLGLYQDVMKVFCDSQSAIYLSRDHVHHARTKHMDVRYHFIREVIEEGDIKLVKINTKDNPADMLTKVVSNQKYQHCMTLIQVRGIMIE